MVSYESETHFNWILDQLKRDLFVVYGRFMRHVRNRKVFHNLSIYKNLRIYTTFCRLYGDEFYRDLLKILTLNDYPPETKTLRL